MDETIAELLGRNWDQLSDDELLESVRRVEAWSRQLYAVTLAVTKEADSRGLAGRQGVSSTAVLLRHGEEVAFVAVGHHHRCVDPAVDHRPGEFGFAGGIVLGRAMIAGATANMGLRTGVEVVRWLLCKVEPVGVGRIDADH